MVEPHIVLQLAFHRNALQFEAMSIATKTGDKGETALGDGTRRPKHDLRIQAYGTVDETNAAIGLARLHTRDELDKMLGRIQNDLFDLGADLSTPVDGRRGDISHDAC